MLEMLFSMPLGVLFGVLFKVLFSVLFNVLFSVLLSVLFNGRFDADVSFDVSFDVSLDVSFFVCLARFSLVAASLSRVALRLEVILEPTADFSSLSFEPPTPASLALLAAIFSLREPSFMVVLLAGDGAVWLVWFAAGEGVARTGVVTGIDAGAGCAEAVLCVALGP